MQRLPGKDPKGIDKAKINKRNYIKMRSLYTAGLEEKPTEWEKTLANLTRLKTDNGQRT